MSLSFDSLPKEMLNKILNYLDFNELNSVSSVDKHWHDVARTCQTNSLKDSITEVFYLHVRYVKITSISIPPSLFQNKIVTIIGPGGKPTPFDLSTYTKCQILALKQNIMTALEEEKTRPKIIENGSFKRNNATTVLIDQVKAKFAFSEDNWLRDETANP
jgi:hypothetical protein